MSSQSNSRSGSRLRGAMTAIITPFLENEEIDQEALARFADVQHRQGIDGLVVAGTTGESATLTLKEQELAFQVVREVVGSKIPVILGTGTNSTRETIERTKHAVKLQADAALIVCPYYNKPTQEGLYRHYEAVYKATGARIIAYNVPGRTASDLLPETIERLVKAKIIVAVKDATANLHRATETWERTHGADDFALLSGDDFTILPFIACGGVGVISVVSNLLPKDTAELVRGAIQNPKQVQHLQAKIAELSQALFAVSNPIPVKTACALSGWCKPYFRLPLCPAGDALNQTLIQAINHYRGSKTDASIEGFIS